MKTKRFLSMFILSVILLVGFNTFSFAKPLNNKFKVKQLKPIKKSYPTLKIHKIPTPTLKLKDIKLGPKNRILVIIECVMGHPSRETLKNYSIKIKIMKYSSSINLYNLSQKKRVQFRGKQVLCFTEIPIQKTTLVKTTLLKDKKAVSSLTKNLMVKNIASFGRRSPAIQKEIDKPNLSAIKTIKNLPDLVIAAFTVLSSTPAYISSYAIYPVRVKVKNQGGVIVDKPFYIGFEYYDYQDRAWKHTNTYFVNNPRIRQNSEIEIRAQLKIPRYLLSHLGNNDLKVRALADAPYGDEFPPKNGRIFEIIENNNYSDEVIIPKDWHPEITYLYRNSIIKGEVLEIYGYDLVCRRNSCAVVMEDSNGRKVKITPIRWLPESISIRVPEEVNTGYNSIYVALLLDTNDFIRVSNKKKVLVLERKELPWPDMVNFFNLLISGGISIRLHTRSGSSYNNVSKIVLLGNESPLNIPKIEFDRRGIHYRYLVDDMNSDKVFVDRTGCSANQLRLVVQFESQDTELKGFSQDWKRVGSWVDGGAPDIEVDNAKLIIFFQLEPKQDGKLNYKSAVSFKASINASNVVADWLMDLFMDGWENQIKRQVIIGVSTALNSPEIKRQITNGLESQIRFQLGIRRTQIITHWEFLNSGVRVTYY